MGLEECVCVYFCALAHFCALCVVACSIFVQYFLALHSPHMARFHKLLIVWHRIIEHYAAVKVVKWITAAVCLLRWLSTGAFQLFISEDKSLGISAESMTYLNKGKQMFLFSFSFTAISTVDLQNQT